MRLIYFADPMCCWCYGFGPEVERLAERLAGRYPLAVVAGGLRTDRSQPLPPAVQADLVEHWRRVHAAAGLPFRFDFFSRHPAFIYDTTAACRALTAVRRLSPLQALQYLAAVQRRFYGAGEDPTRADTLVAAAADCGIAAADFMSAWRDETTVRETASDFAWTRAVPVMAFPSLFLEFSDRLRLIAGGYQRYELLAQVVDGVVHRYGNELDA